jgi:hypothetical protein
MKAGRALNENEVDPNPDSDSERAISQPKRLLPLVYETALAGGAPLAH